MKIYFSFATYWNCKRDKLSSLETSPEFVRFSIPGIISGSLCNLSHSDPDLQVLICNGVLARGALSADVRETKAFASPGVKVLSAQPWNSFCPFQGVLLHVHRAVPNQLLHKARKSAHNHILVL